jgi:hypothetical protein
MSAAMQMARVADAAVLKRVSLATVPGRSPGVVVRGGIGQVLPDGANSAVSSAIIG